jgi:hypothetical protein
MEKGTGSATRRSFSFGAGQTIHSGMPRHPIAKKGCQLLLTLRLPAEIDGLGPPATAPATKLCQRATDTGGGVWGGGPSVTTASQASSSPNEWSPCARRAMPWYTNYGPTGAGSPTRCLNSAANSTPAVRSSCNSRSKPARGVLVQTPGIRDDGQMPRSYPSRSCSKVGSSTRKSWCCVRQNELSLQCRDNLPSPQSGRTAILDRYRTRSAYEPLGLWSSLKWLQCTCQPRRPAGRNGLQATTMATAQVGTIRLKLLKNRRADRSHCSQSVGPDGDQLPLSGPILPSPATTPNLNVAALQPSSQRSLRGDGATRPPASGTRLWT